MPRISLSSKADTRAARTASRSEFGQAAVRVVRREEDLLRRHLAHQVDEVDDAPQRCVEEHARHVREVPCQGSEVGDARVRDDQTDVG